MVSSSMNGQASGANPFRDYQNVAGERTLVPALGGKQVLLSCLVYEKSWLLFKKSKLLILTEDKIIVANSKKQMRFMNKYHDIQGVTKSLRIGANNFVIHFGERAEEEWYADQRDEIIPIIQERYQETCQKPLPLFGLSSASLEDYVTTERDLGRRICKMPTNDYLISKRTSNVNASAVLVESASGDDWDEDEELFDDFVMLERPELERYNEKDALKKESDSKNAGASSCLVGKPGLNGEVVTLEDFEITKVIDKGSFGKVFLVHNKKMKRSYAMKRINKDLLLQKKQVQNIKNEKEILFQADHPFVNSMDFVFQNEMRIYFFLKYLPGGNIYDNIFKVKRFNEPTVKFIGAQLVLALGYLHDKGVVHRDLKPENVLMDADGYISLADFGLAKFLQKADQTFSFCGTAEYLAPEILNMTGHSFSVDWWTLGILLYEMATGRPPFLNKSHHKLGLLIRTGRIVFPDPVKHQIFMSEELKDVILRLLDRDASRRLGSNGDSAEVKAHPFFSDINWDALLRKEILPEYVPKIEDLKESGDEGPLHYGSNPYDSSAQSLGHSILDEDAKDELTEQQKELVRQNQDKFKNF